MDNKVRELRQKAGYTQASLAKAIGTSQQQVQRIEQGTAAKLDLALRICAALDCSMERVFPKTRATIRKLKKMVAPADMLEEIVSDPDLQESLGEVGIDADPAQWMLKLRLVTGVTRVYDISGLERRRLWSVLQDGRFSADCVDFLVFETHDKTVAVNRRAIDYAHLLFEPRSTRDERETEGGAVTVHFMSYKEPLQLEMERDDALPAEGEDDEGQLRHVLAMLDSDCEEHYVFVLTDIDGETAFLRAGAIAMLEVPLDFTDAPCDDDDDEPEVASRKSAG
jgi:DNA-binding XRE family transcriptional regulator